MRNDYVAIVLERLADPSIKASKKLSFCSIAKRLNALGHKAPNGGDITYKIARRLSEIVGEVCLPQAPEQIIKDNSELEVGDCVEIVAHLRPSHGELGIIQKIADDREGYAVQLSRLKPKLRVFLAHEIRHYPNAQHFYDPLSRAEK